MQVITSRNKTNKAQATRHYVICFHELGYDAYYVLSVVKHHHRQAFVLKTH